MADATVQSIEIMAPAKAVFAVAADLDHYTEWASAVKSVKVLEKDRNGRAKRAAFVVDGMVKEISYTLSYVYDEPTSIAWTAEPGPDIRSMEGSYSFNTLDDGGTEVVYALKADPAFIIPGFLRRQVEKQIVSTALRGLRKRVEQVSSG
jgi:uncharacterized membrane protein